jgi:hypothetical protein
MNIEDATLSLHVRTTIGDVMTGAEQLRGLAHTLDSFCDLSGAAGADEMRQVAISIKATAVHALNIASNVAGLSDRLDSVATILEAIIPDSEPPPHEAA